MCCRAASNTCAVFLQAKVISIDVQAGSTDTAAQQEETVRRVLVGHSLGGACAAAEAIANPEVSARKLSSMFLKTSSLVPAFRVLDC